jgi:hypothetical protein
MRRTAVRGIEGMHGSSSTQVKISHALRTGHLNRQKRIDVWK